MNIPEFLSSISSQKETRLFWDIGQKKKFDMRLHPTKITSPSFEAEVVNESGNRLTFNELDFVTYKGYLSNNDAIRLTIDEDFIYGGIHSEKGTIMIEQLMYFLDDKTISPSKLIVYSIEHLTDEELECGNTDTDFGNKLRSTNSTVVQKSSSAGCDILEVVLDCDNTYWNLYSGNSIGRMLGEINLIQEVYENELDIVLNVTGAYAFNPVYQSSNSSTILNEIQSRWAPSNISHISRDIVHHFTRKSTGIFGRASGIGVVCGSTPVAFSNDRARVHQTVAHEIGHLLDGEHSDGGNCGVEFARTIMCQGDNKALTFNVNAENRIGNYVNSVSCMNFSTINIEPVGSDDDLCINDRLWLELDDLVRTDGTTITWSLSNGRAIIDSPQNRNSIWIKGISTGTVTLTATINFPGTCGSVVVTRLIQVGSGNITIDIMGPDSSGWIILTANGGSSPYNWTLNGTTNWTSTSSVTSRFVGCNGGYIQVTSNGSPC